MTKQEIIDMLWHLSFQFDGDKAVIDKNTIGTIADTLLAKIEQEKKETAKEILKDLYNEAIRQQCETVNLTAYYIKNTLAKEYGVEL